MIEGGLDPAVERLVFHALEKRPAERHKDMAAFIYELRTVMDMLGFGRRAKAGPAKRVVIEQRPADIARRDELSRIAFDACRLPLALVTPQGVIVAANPAFAKFVMGVAVEVEGLPIRSTPLATAWSTCEQDLQCTLSGNPIRRITGIDVAAKESAGCCCGSTRYRATASCSASSRRAVTQLRVQPPSFTAIRSVVSAMSSISSACPHRTTSSNARGEPAISALSSTGQARSSSPTHRYSGQGSCQQRTQTSFSPRSARWNARQLVRPRPAPRRRMVASPGLRASVQEGSASAPCPRVGAQAGCGRTEELAPASLRFANVPRPITRSLGT
jgi:hypothetical protein